MNCISCNKELTSTLSICPRCGTMVCDSVREELALKISPITKISGQTIKAVVSVTSVTPVLPPPIVEPIQPPAIAMTIEEPAIVVVKPAAKKTQTAELIVKQTSPTLMEFNNKNAMLPDWRLQMQNAVVKRRGGNSREMTQEPSRPQVVAVSRQSALATKGATALNFQVEENPLPAVAPKADSPLDRALRRIESARQMHLATETQVKAEMAENLSSVKYFPSVLPNRAQEFSPKLGQSQTVARFTARPNIAPISELKAEKFDTNKLPPLPVAVLSNFENRSATYVNLNADFEDEELIETVNGEKPVEAIEEETDDCAPLNLRFNAAIFDLLIGSFASLLLLSPFMLLNGKFFSTEGFLAFLATCAIVMFVYMTASIGFLGRTFGMKMFSLEIVDIDENAYPTIHQAAVSSSLYLVSLALGGLGFLTLLVNNEKRAAHDLLSGTIIVKEY